MKLEYEFKHTFFLILCHNNTIGEFIKKLLKKEVKK